MPHFLLNSNSRSTPPADAALARSTSEISLFRKKPLRCTLAYTLSLLFIWQPLLVAAQPLTATHQTSGRPTIDEAANGVPIVNIQTPNSGGVSQNFYNDFNVGGSGLILNNSRQLTQTQLGGQIEGNPNLTGGSARLILNEVISNNPSALNGYIEVGGVRADVVVANPNGISCNGCGFINTNHATLTTGQPIMDGSSLSGFNVQQGAVSILEEGLNAANTTRFDVIARSVEVAGALHADTLNIVTGQQTVERNSLNTTNITSDANKPSFAIDSTALGGMYANRIRLIANEEGVGVRLNAPVSAQNGDLQLSANGNIQYTDLAATRDISITANQYGVEGMGTVLAEGDFTLQADSYENSGDVIAEGRVDVTTTTSITNSGTLAGREKLTLQTDTLANNPGGALLSEGNIDIAADHVTNTLADIYALGSINIEGTESGTAATQVENRSGRIQAEGDLNIGATALNNMRDFLDWEEKLVEGNLYYYCTDCSGDHLIVVYTFTEHFFRALDAATTGRSVISADGNMTLRGDTLVNNTSDILALGNMTLDFNEIQNLGLHSGEYTKKSRYGPHYLYGPLHESYVYSDIAPYNRRNYHGGAWYASDGANKDLEYMGLRPNSVNSNYDPDNLLRREDNIIHRNVGLSSTDIVALESTNILGANILAGGNLVFGGAADSAAIINADLGHVEAEQYDPDAIIALGAGSQGGSIDNYLTGVNGGLFSIADPGHPYLIETNPFFASTGGFLGSEYLLNRLGWDPDGALRLLGDGFYEQQLIRQQIVDLTGRASLSKKHVDANKQYRILLDNGLYAAESLELAIGVSLTAEQINQLTSDIVWMIEKEVAGEVVLVPQLYLSPQSIVIDNSSGALIAAGNNLINNGGSVYNTGTMHAGNDMRLNLDENGLRNIGGTIIAENTLRIDSEGDVENISGTLQGKKIDIGALGDIINQRWSSQREFAHGGIHEWQTHTGAAAEINGANKVRLHADGDINVEGSRISGGNVSLDADGNINIGTVAVRNGREGAYYGGTLSESSVRHLSSDIISTLNLLANAGNDLNITGSHLNSDRAIALNAGNDLTIQSAANSDSYNFLSRHDGETSHTIERSVRHQGSTINAQGNVSLQSDNNLTVIASKLEAGKDLSLLAVGDVQLLAERDSDYRYSYEEDDKWYGSKISIDTKYDETARVVELAAGGNVQINASSDPETGAVTTWNDAKGDVLFEGTKVHAGGDTLVYAGNELRTTAIVEESYQHSETRREYSGVASSAAGVAGVLASFAALDVTMLTSGQGVSFDVAGNSASGSTQQRLVDTQFSGNGKTILLAGEGVTLEAGKYQGGNLLISSGLNEDSVASTSIIGLQTHNSYYKEESRYRFGQTEGFGSLSTQSEETRSLQQNISHWHGTGIDITDDVLVQSAGDLIVQGADITAGNNVNFSTNGHLLLLAGQSSTSHSNSIESDANLGEYTAEQLNSSTLTSEVTSINAGGAVSMSSVGNQVYQGSDITSGGDQTYTSLAGSVDFLAVTDVSQTSHTEQSSDFSWVTMKSEGTLNQTARMVSLQPGGDIIINAANGINVDIKQINGETGPALVAALVEQNPEMAWLQQLSDQGDIDWNEVQDVNERWSEESETLGGGAAAVIAIVVTVLTGGAGTGIVGGLGATTTATAATATAAATTVSAYTLAAAAATQAVVSSAVTQATISTINNGGKLDRSLSDLGQKDSLRGLGASALTAGLTVGVDNLFEGWKWGREGAVQTDTALSITKGFNLDTWQGMTGFAAHSATDGLASALVNDAIYGGSFSDHLRGSMENQGNDVLSAFAFNWVGTFADNQLEEAGNNGNLANAGRYVEGGINRTLLHATVGGLVTEITIGDFATGAAAAGLNQALSPSLDRGLNDTRWRTAGSQLTGLAGALIVGGDINAGSWIAKQADSYNRQLHSQEIAFALDDERVKRFRDTYGLTDAEARQELLRTGAAAMDAGWAAALEGDATNSERASDFLAAELIASGQEHLFWTTEDEFYNQRVGLKELFADKEALGAMLDYASIDNSFTREESWAASGQGSGEGLKDAIGISDHGDVLASALFIFGGDRYRAQVVSDAVSNAATDLSYLDSENRLRVMQGDWLGLERDLSRSATSMGIGLGASMGFGLASRPLTLTKNTGLDDFFGPFIGRSGFKTSSSFADESFKRYQGFVDEGYELALAAESKGLLNGNKGTRIGDFVDRFSATEYRSWLSSEGLSEGPGSFVQMNRWLRDPSGSGQYVRPDIRISSGSILDATVGWKWGSTKQIVRFNKFSDGDIITNVRPQKLGGSYSIWPRGSN